MKSLPKINNIVNDFYNFVFPKFLVAIFRQSDPLQTNVLSLKIRIIELLFFEINIFAKL